MNTLLTTNWLVGHTNICLQICFMLVTLEMLEHQVQIQQSHPSPTLNQSVAVMEKTLNKDCAFRKPAATTLSTTAATAPALLIAAAPIVPELFSATATSEQQHLYRATYVAAQQFSLGAAV